MARQREALTLDDLPDIMTLADAADRVHMSHWTLRHAIRDGELVAFIPRGRHALKAGPGQGYRITRAALQSWYFHDPDLLVTKDVADG